MRGWKKGDLVEEIELVEESTFPSHSSERRMEGERALVPFKELMSNEFRRALRRMNTFIYGKVGLYENLLIQVFGKSWQQGRWSILIREEKQLEEVAILRKTLVLIPAVQDENKLNHLVAKAIRLGNPVWLVGYPSTIHKHLWANFSCFILTSAPESELRILRDVVGLTVVDIERLSLESRIPMKGLIVTPTKIAYIRGRLA